MNFLLALAVIVTIFVIAFLLMVAFVASFGEMEDSSEEDKQLALQEIGKFSDSDLDSL